jgi:hypothetical protein
LIKKLKCHIKKEINPYPQYSYSERQESYYPNPDWILWQFNHGKNIMPNEPDLNFK